MLVSIDRNNAELADGCRSTKVATIVEIMRGGIARASQTLVVNQNHGSLGFLRNEEWGGFGDAWGVISLPCLPNAALYDETGFLVLDRFTRLSTPALTSRQGRREALSGKSLSSSISTRVFSAAPVVRGRSQSFSRAHLPEPLSG